MVSFAETDLIQCQSSDPENHQQAMPSSFERPDAFDPGQSPSPGQDSSIVVPSLMATGQADFDRETSRFQLCENETSEKPVTSFLTFRPSQTEAFRIPTELVDLHAAGCAIRYRAPKPLPQSLSLLEIENLTRVGVVKTLAGVCWTQQTGIDFFTSGLKFKQPLDEQVLAQGIAKGTISRRTTIRTAVDVPVSVRQNQPPVVCECRIVSTSESGLQIVGPEQATAGARVMMKLADGKTTLGTAAWSVPRGNEFATGVAFVDLMTGFKFHDSVLVQHNG